jgi:hypothetical protein
VQFSSISKFGLLEMSRQRLRPALSEGNHITCPRCNGTGHIRDTESSALQILRMVQEESMKDNTAAVHVQVPVEVTSFLLNEKRTEITKIELKQRVTVLLVPNKHLETPNYKLERLRHDDPRLEGLQASYTMIEEPDDEVGITRREKTKAKQEPSSRACCRTSRHRPHRHLRLWPHRRRPPWQRLPRSLHRRLRPTPDRVSSPGCASCSAARHLRPRRPRWRHPWRPRQRHQPRRPPRSAKAATAAAVAVASAVNAVATAAANGAVVAAAKVVSPEKAVKVASRARAVRAAKAVATARRARPAPKARPPRHAAPTNAARVATGPVTAGARAPIATARRAPNRPWTSTTSPLPTRCPCPRA